MVGVEAGLELFPGDELYRVSSRGRGRAHLGPAPLSGQAANSRWAAGVVSAVMPLVMGDGLKPLAMR